jgi:hypothetical protein
MKEYLIKAYSQDQEATDAVNKATKHGWSIERMSADDRRLWIVFSREARPREDGATEPLTPPRRSEPPAKSGFE